MFSPCVCLVCLCHLLYTNTVTTRICQRAIVEFCIFCILAKGKKVTHTHKNSAPNTNQNILFHIYIYNTYKGIFLPLSDS